MIMQGVQTLRFRWNDKSVFAQPKMIAPSWPRVVRPVADGKDIATRGLLIGLLIGLFLASLFQD